MPDWSPVRRFGGYAAWGEREAPPVASAFKRMAAQACDCAEVCGVHGRDHATGWSSQLPIADLKGFWVHLGRACWAV